jgi:hypothetical protein
VVLAKGKLAEYGFVADLAQTSPHGIFRGVTPLRLISGQIFLGASMLLFSLQIIHGYASLLSQLNDFARGREILR